MPRVLVRPLLGFVEPLTAYSEAKFLTLAEPSRYVSATLMIGRGLPIGGLGFLCFQNIGETNAVVFGRDCLEPMTHIAPEHERI